MGVIIGRGAGMRRPDSMVRIHMPYDGEASTFRDRAGHGIATNQGTIIPVHSVIKRKFVGKSMYCNYYGSGFECNCYYADSPDWVIGTTPFTIKFWMNVTSLPKNGKVDRYTGQSNNTGGFQILVGVYNYNGNMQLLIGVNGTVLFMYRAFAFQTNTWYHVLVHRDSNFDIRMFVNGSQIGTLYNHTGALADVVGGWNLAAATHYSGGGYGFKGYMDEYQFIIGRAEWPRGLGHTPEAPPMTRRY